MMRSSRLTQLALGATLLLVTIGGLVRATKSGLGCGTDWPHCAGRLVPALESRAEMIEFSHRAAASVVIVLLGLLAVASFRSRRTDPKGAALGAGAFGLVMFQAVLGAIVVKLELEASSVVLHLSAAMALVGLLVFMTLRARPPHPEAPGLHRSARIAAGSVLLLLLVGSYVSGVTAEKGAGFPDWPLVDGALIPDLSSQIFALHWVHRLLAVVVTGILWWTWRRAMTEGDAMSARLASIAMGGLVAEMVVGAANVWTQSDQGLNSASITIHLALGAFIWAALIALATITRPAKEAPEHARRAALSPEGSGA
jgi:heme a synthase